MEELFGDLTAMMDWQVPGGRWKSGVLRDERSTWWRVALVTGIGLGRGVT